MGAGFLNLVYNISTMIRLISGKVSWTNGNQIIVETASGLGYLVAVTHRLLALPDEEIRLYTHLAVRETALDLYGFTTTADLELFELLLTISGIGPKSAMQIMDQADRRLIAESIKLEDATHLSKASGLSKKTAEKILLGLKDKLDTSQIVDTNAYSSVYQDAFDTLVTLGYNPATVRATLDSLELKETTSAVVTEALRKLN